MLVSSAVLLILTLLGLLFFRLQQYKKYNAFYNKPAPFYLPILATTYLFIGKNLFTVVDYLMKKYGKTCVIYVPYRTYLTSDPDEIKIILNQTIEKSKVYDHLKLILEGSLLMAEESVWKKNRKLLSRSFNQTMLDSFVPVFYRKSVIALDFLRSKEYNNIFQLFESLTLDIFFETTIGVDSSILEERDTTFITALTEAQEETFLRVGNILKMNDHIFALLPSGRKCNNSIKKMFAILEPIVIEKKKKILEEDVVLNCKDLRVLDLLVNASNKENITNDYIITEIMLFALATTDTSAHSTAFTLTMLAMHPEIQQKVYEEVIDKIGDNEITEVNLLELKYTEMVIFETLRLFPAIPMIGRQAKCDIDIGSCVLPKDTGVVISLYHLHRNEKNYPNPSVFDPNRFLPENVAARPPSAYLPFSGGPRNCIGWKYAQMTMKTVVATIIRSFHVTSPYHKISDFKLMSSAVLCTKPPLKLNFIPREKFNAK